MNRFALFVIIFAVALAAPTRAAADPTVVFEWNQKIQDTIPGGGGAGAPRFFALAHIAMFDAVNAIEREFEQYHVRLQARERLARGCGGTGGARRHGCAQSRRDGRL